MFMGIHRVLSSGVLIAPDATATTSAATGTATSATTVRMSNASIQ